VTGAQLAHGILQISLLKEIPDAMKAKKIQINSLHPTAIKEQ